MKKFLGIVALSLLFCNIAQAKECKGSPLEEEKNTLTLLKVSFIWRDCHGTLIYKDGSKYIGEFKDGKFNGQGLFTFPDGGELEGHKYEGEWKDDKKHGEGVLLYINGSKLEGEFRKGNPWNTTLEE